MNMHVQKSVSVSVFNSLGCISKTQMMGKIERREGNDKGQNGQMASLTQWTGALWAVFFPLTLC